MFFWTVLKCVYIAMHMPAPFSSSAACDGMFSTKLNHPVGFRSVISFCVVCVPGLVRRLEPNPQQAREEETIGGRHSDGHQSNGVGPTGSACQEHQQVLTDDKHLKQNICSHKLYFIPFPQNRDNPACEGTLVNCYIIEVPGVTCSCTAVSMVKVNISSQFVGKVFIPAKPESAGTKLTASQIK